MVIFVVFVVVKVLCPVPCNPHFQNPACGPEYHPLDEMSQHFMCEALGLQIIRPNEVVPGGPEVNLTRPNLIRHIHDDSNSLFRSFSFYITGLEHGHTPKQNH